MDLVIEEEGFLNLTLGTVKKAVDIYRFWNDLCDIRVQSEAEPVQVYHDKVLDYLANNGFKREELSHRTADKVVERMFTTMEEMKKKESGSPTPNLPDSTESASSTSPPDQSSDSST